MDAEGTFGNMMLKGKPELKTDAEKHRGFTLNYARLRFDIDKMLEKQVPDENLRAAMKDAMKKLVGEESQTWFGTDGKVVVSISAKDWPSAQKRLDDYLDGNTAAKDPTFQQARRELPAEQSMVVLIDAPRFSLALGDYMATMFKAMPGLPVPVPNLKPVKPGAPSFVGLTVTLRPEEGSIDFFVPGPAVQAVRKAIEKATSGDAD
jgi:hypothetical protein